MTDGKKVYTDTELLELQIQRYRPRYLKDEKEEVAHIKSKIQQIKPHVTKSDVKASELRKLGNVQFQNKSDKDALILYTQSLSFAKSDEEVSVAYGNRSAALFYMGFYEECLADIDRAFRHGYPESLSAKLFKRKKDATKAYSDRKKVVKVKTYEIPQSEMNPSIQSARNCIEIQANEKYGRHIVASRDIAIGEVLAVDNPYLVELQADMSSDPFLFCCECLKHCYNVIPCLNCNEAYYCTEICRAKAFQNYHKYECLILPYVGQLFGIKFDFWLFSLKITLLAMTEEKNDETMYRSDRYKEISELEGHSNADPPEQTYVLTLLSASIFILIKEKIKIFKEFEVFEEKFKELFLYHQQVFKVNAVTIVSWHGNDKFYTSVTGLALYSLYSLFNHSCYPNTFWNTSGSTMVVRASLPIKKGEQCFISYGPYFAYDNKTERQERLQRLYRFTCECRACQENWPKVTFSPASVDCKFIKQVIKKLTENQALPPPGYILSLRKGLEVAYRILDGTS
ncbi:SET and MYND domain-containing protein 4-like [Zophobas morio]|uniref:SET and MYND domain-containing protein 4-like n=1 Tax=Zophobas morio TaxID=2755281 RepID=UPI0030836697